MAINTDYIREILERFEGKGISKGYVPADKSGKPLGASGVTIATGLDLGQQTGAGLEKMGLPLRIVGLLRPYLGVKGQAAQYLLVRTPLNLSREDVATIDAAVHAAYIDRAAGLFGRAAFEAAPREVQAVAASLHYQFGGTVREASPALSRAWSAMRAGEYKRAAAILRDPSGWSPSHQQYLARRQGEAGLLDKAVA